MPRGVGAGGFRQGGGPTSIGARALLWIILSSAFLTVDILKLSKLRAAGLQPGWFLWAQIVLWTLALLFWAYSGIQSLRKGRVS